MEFVDGLGLLDAVALLKDRVDELFESEAIPQKTYVRKSSFRQLLRAVNKADRMICNIRKKLQTTALYIPAGVTTFPLSDHGVYAGHAIDSIVKSTLMEKHPSAIEVFLNEQPWIEIAGIESEYARVYRKHPVHTVTAEREIKRVNLTDPSRASGQAPSTFSYDTERRILHLSDPFGDDGFLVFEARMRPGKIAIRNYDA
jgi:hypothetical protein